MIIKKLTFLSILFLANSAHSATLQDTIPVKDLKAYFETVKISKNKISIPKVKNYEVELIGSDNQAVIDLNGNIHQPLVSKSVNLLFKIKSKKSKNITAEIPTKNVSIAGQYPALKGNKQPFVIPALREWVGNEGNYTFSGNSKIVYSDTSATSKEAAILLQEDIKKLLNINVSLSTSKPVAGDIVIAYSKDKALGKDGYAISIGDVFEITAPQYAGKVFGTRTLLQLLDQDRTGLHIPKGLVRDYPSYEVRAFMLDVARKFFTIDFLNDYVEFMSYYKMSNFHVHLNDNGFKQYFNNDWSKTYSGFRLENETYPNLASKDGHYSKKEFMDLQKRALRYGITIIPEIDVPAHSLAIAHAIPEVGSVKFGMDHLDLNNPKSFEVVKNIFDEYTKGPNPVFMGEEVHVGTDEYDKSEAEKFRAFTDFVFKTVQDNGKKVRAWGALTHAKGTTPVRVKDVTLNMWYNGYADPIEMKKLGYPQISTPDGYLYIVPFAGYYYDYLNTNSLYNSWSPRKIGNVVFEEGDPIIRGGSFAVWNDVVGNGISEKDVHNRVFPAMQVLAQKMWGGDNEKPRLFEFNSKREFVKEAPGLNMRGAFVDYKAGLIYQLSFANNLNNTANTSFAAATSTGVSFESDKLSSIKFAADQGNLSLPIHEIGESYTVSFWINPSRELSGDLFKSKNASIYYTAEGLGYTRDGYKFNTDLKLPQNTWSLVTVTGDKSSTQFYLNDKLVKDLKPETIILPNKDSGGKEVKFNKIKTLVFPLAHISLKNANLADFKVYNTKLNSAEITDEYHSSKK